MTASLEAGLAAIQQGNYPDAIALLDSVLAAPPDAATYVRAQMALVRAYIETGQVQSAIGICKALHQSESEKVRSWANRTMDELTGFVPVTRSSEPRRKVRPRTKALIKPTAPSESPSQKVELPRFPISTEDVGFVWRNAGRAQRWQPLNRSITRSRLVQGVTIAAMFGTLYGLCAIAQIVQWFWFRTQTEVLRWSTSPPDDSIPVWLLLFGLITAFFASPWILDALLKWIDRSRPLLTAELSRYSPETYRLIQRFAAQHKIPIPRLILLPTQTPIVFTYGCLPKLARIAISQGVLDLLSDDELAAIVAHELGHIAHWDFCWMSLVTVMMQIPYTVYRQSAIVSDKLRHNQHASKLITTLLAIGADALIIVAALSYGLFWVMRGSGLWLSRQRTIESDRHACDLTGNPNGLARALLKLSIATVQTIQQQQKTDYLLEGFELLAPIGYNSAMTIGSLYEKIPLSNLLQWDQTNLDRHCLTINNAHRLIGERLATLMKDAAFWNLEPEFNLMPTVKPVQNKILIQGAPFFGIAIGSAIAQLLWLVAQLLYTLGNYQLNWIASDYKLFISFALIGFGTGTIVRFNRFFPQLRQFETAFADLLTKPELTPINSRPIQLEGQLLGRSTPSNGVLQDVMLQTEAGLIKLCWTSQLGSIGNLLVAPRLLQSIGETVIVTGWFRRGATPWIDVDSIKLANRSVLRGGHPVASVAIAIAAILLGLILMM